MKINIGQKLDRIGGRFYLVQFGDSLFTIAQKFDTSVEDITAYNEQIKTESTIIPGEILFIPGQTAVTQKRKRRKHKGNRRLRRPS